MSAPVRWQTPPDAVRGPRPGYNNPIDWPAVLATLKANPDRWGIVAVLDDSRSAAQTAYMLRIGRLAGARGQRFDATSRRVAGEYRVYARYVDGAA